MYCMSSLKNPMRVDEWLQSREGRRVDPVDNLILIYDRNHVSPCFSEIRKSVILTTTELPLYAFAYAGDDPVCKFSSEPPHRSNTTFTIEFFGYQTAGILKKALTPNGPKHYNITCMFLDGIEDVEREFKDTKYQDIHLHIHLRLEAPEEETADVKLENNGKYKLFSASRYHKFTGSRRNFMRRFKV